MKIIYGADYNPEQWPESVWLEDMRQMKEMKVNMVNLNIFGWALLETEEGVYDFTMLDKLMDLLYEHGIDVDLATATASQPAWLSQKYEDVLPVDKHMNKIWYGSRQAYCPNSVHYYERAKALVTLIANRYKHHPALKMWHINNEYSDHTTICYCDRCAIQFRKWLADKYTLEEINDRWGTHFWSQKYYHYSEIIPPRQTSADPNPGLVLDYKRFMCDAFLKLYLMEYNILKKATPHLEMTTNFMGNDNKPLDYKKWSDHIDVISWDSYPDPVDSESPMKNALTHDLMRSYKKQHHILMEQAPNQVNWRQTNPNRKPGETILYSLQALAHGAKGVMFFQWRQSLKGAEKFHSAMIPHNGTKTRSYQEVKKLGALIDTLEPSTVEAKVGLYFDYDNWWAIEYEPGPSHKMKYMDLIRGYYRYFYHKNIPVDFVFKSDQLKDYETVVVPNGYMIHDDHLFREYVKSGGQLIMGPFSGIVDESHGVYEEGYMSTLSDIFGLEILGYDSIVDPMSSSINTKCHTWFDEISLCGAESLVTITEGFYSGMPLVTSYKYDAGQAIYIGGLLEDMTEVLSMLIKIDGIDSPNNVEIRKTSKYTYVLNHSSEQVSVKIDEKDLELNAYDYRIIKR